MAFTIEKILGDARLLCTRLKDHDNAADTLIEQAQNLDTKVEAMQTYQEDLNELNEIARHRPRSNLIMGLVQESSQIRELQQENKELRVALEEHQSALELIMSKYREQVYKLVMMNKLDKKSTSQHEQQQELQEKMEKICEMAAVMQRAIRLDDASAERTAETASRLAAENSTLRELLRAAYINAPPPPPRPETRDDAVQTEDAAVAGEKSAAGRRSPQSDNDGEDDDEEDDDDDMHHNFGAMDESYTSTDNSYDNPMSRSVIEVFPNKDSSLQSDALEQDENANSSTASSDVESNDNASVVAAN